LHLLISVRESTLDLFTAELGNGAQYHLDALDYHAALEAVTRPLGRTSRCFMPGAAEKLVRGLVTDKVEATAENRDRSFELGHVEPALLQIVCARLWELLSDEVSVISERDILRYGDADAALAAYWGRVIAAVAASHGISVEQLHAWLVRTFVTEMGTRGTAYEGLSETAGMPNAVARAFEDGYLLTTERRSSAIWYQLLAERLVEPLRHAPVIRPPPVGPDDYLRAAGRAYALGEFIPAEHYAEDALRVLAGADFRRLAQANSLLGNVAYERGRPAEAAEHYRAAAGLYEAIRDSAAVASQLAAVGQMLLAQGSIPEAVDELRAAVDRAPQDLAVHTKLGGALWEMGQRQAAVEVLSGVLSVDGSTAEAVRVRGEILVDLGHPRDALRDLDRMAQDEWPSARAARGLARTELGEPGADKDIEGALADAPRNGSVLLYAARAKALAGDKAAAVELARHALNATDPALRQHQREAALHMAGQNLPDCH
jgi:tetratricopeptide (TPR) repeat protein